MPSGGIFVTDRPRFLLPALTLAARELERFFRQINRVIGAFLQPIIFWILFGAGLKNSFRPLADGSMNAMQYFLPGTAVLIVLFTAIFSTISVIEDRNEGFLQGVLVAPVSRLAIVFGKVLGGTALAVPQGFVVLLAAPLVGVRLSLESLAASLLILTLVSLSLTAVGFCIAWPMDSTQGFHAIMTVILFPMWILSGSFFPLGQSASWLRIVMFANPLTYGVAALRYALHTGQPAALAGLPPLWLSLTVTCGFVLVMTGLASWLVSRPAKGRRG